MSCGGLSLGSPACQLPGLSLLVPACIKNCEEHKHPAFQPDHCSTSIFMMRKWNCALVGSSTCQLPFTCFQPRVLLLKTAMDLALSSGSPTKYRSEYGSQLEDFFFRGLDLTSTLNTIALATFLGVVSRLLADFLFDAMLL